MELHHAHLHHLTIIELPLVWRKRTRRLRGWNRVGDITNLTLIDVRTNSDITINDVLSLLVYVFHCLQKVVNNKMGTSWHRSTFCPADPLCEVRRMTVVVESFSDLNVVGQNKVMNRQASWQEMLRVTAREPGVERVRDKMNIADISVCDLSCHHPARLEIRFTVVVFAVSGLCCSEISTIIR